jgi:hypothetical protein
MPSIEIKCEFCDKLFRKNEVARHIKSKHVTDLAKFLLDEYIENPTSNCLQRYANCINPKCNGLESKLYDEGVYYFGANPAYFEGDGWGSYTKSDENMKLHNEFLADIIKNISLFDFLEAKRDIIVKSDEQRKLLIESSKQREEIECLKQEVESLKSRNSYLQGVVNDFKVATECSSTIQNMKDNIDSANKVIRMYKEDLEDLQKKYDAKCESIVNHNDEMTSENLARVKQVEQQWQEAYNRVEKAEKELKEAKDKRESYANQKVEKEKIQWEKEQKKKDKKYKEQIKKLKLKMIDSDSDSDSDSD